ncbi:hypothetical protein KC325_g106 [Hortaea werneckii]|nr:hypothetical protein KC325_g106 [Hortaea werneckii]
MLWGRRTTYPVSQITSGREMASQSRVRLEGVWDHGEEDVGRLEAVEEVRWLGDVTRVGEVPTWFVVAVDLEVVLGRWVGESLVLAVSARVERFVGDSEGGASKSLGWLRVATILLTRSASRMKSAHGRASVGSWSSSVI